jgi:hypothetical protein
MNHRSKCLIPLSVGILGLGLLTYGTQSHTEVRIAGEAIPVFVLARAFGLIAVLGSVAGLALYGNSLPLTRTEREGRLRHGVRRVGDAKTLTNESAADVHCPPGPARSSTRPSLRLVRSSTEARLRIAGERAQHKKDKRGTKRTSQAA